MLLLLQVNSWLDILQVHVVSELPDIQHRACHIVMNIVTADKSLANLVVESPMLEILIAVSKQKDHAAEMATKSAQKVSIDGQTVSYSQYLKLH